MELNFNKGNPSGFHFQYLEDLATAYWYSEVLFCALELKIFSLLDKAMDIESLAKKGGFDKDQLLRLLKALKSLGLLVEFDGIWENSQLAFKYLDLKSKEYIGDFILYRRYVQKNWSMLKDKIVGNGKNDFETNSLSLKERMFLYVKAMDQILRLKSKEICEVLRVLHWSPPILDIGGGAGALLRTLLAERKGKGILIELPEVIEAANILYPEAEYWKDIQTLACDFRIIDNSSIGRFGLVVMSNFLHAYSQEEAEVLLKKATNLIKDNGLLLIHDYFPDRDQTHPHKGLLYDLHMLINTYNGRCHESSMVDKWATDLGLKVILKKDLESDTSLLVYGKGFDYIADELEEWAYKAKILGFSRAITIDPKSVIVTAKVSFKCRYGCSNFDKNLACPPNAPHWKETQELLKEYSKGLLVFGTPPGKDFHQRLISLEREAFLKGYTKAMVFGAGPCPLCHSCPEDKVCRHPELKRPSMEGSGIDVYKTLKGVGVELKPLADKNQYVTYIGLFLLE